MMRRAILLLGVGLVCAGCFDFFEPDFPEAGAPAVLQSSAFVDEHGNLTVDALLAPGQAIGGVQRGVPRDTLDVFGLKLAPTEVRRNGSRAYHFEGKLPAAAQPQEFTLAAPRVEEVAGPPPHADWFGIRRTDPDTIVWQRGTDLVLHVSAPVGASAPTPPIRQWFVELHGGDRNFRISSDGFPPQQIRIQSDWVPEPLDSGIITASLTMYQAGAQHSPSNDYIGNLSYNLLLRWVIKVTEP